MNTKLTLTLNPKVIDKAKRYAKKRKTSVSKIVENYFSGLQSSLENDEMKLTGVVEELAGILKDRNIKNDQSEITGYLEKKYQ